MYKNLVFNFIAKKIPSLSPELPRSIRTYIHSYLLPFLYGWRMFYPELPVVIYMAPFKKCVVYDFIGIEILSFFSVEYEDGYIVWLFFFLLLLLLLHLPFFIWINVIVMSVGDDFIGWFLVILQQQKISKKSYTCIESMTFSFSKKKIVLVFRNDWREGEKLGNL